MRHYLIVSSVFFSILSCKKENSASHKEDNSYQILAQEFNFTSLTVKFKQNDSLDTSVLNSDFIPLTYRAPTTFGTVVHSGDGLTWWKNQDIDEWVSQVTADRTEENPKRVYFTSAHSFWSLKEDKISHGVEGDANQASVQQVILLNSLEEGLLVTEVKVLFATDDSLLFTGDDKFYSYKKTSESSVVKEFSWPPTPEETLPILSAWEVGDNEIYVVTEKKLYRLLKDTRGIWSWTSPVDITFEGLSGGVKSVFFTVSLNSEGEPKAKHMSAITTQGYFDDNGSQETVVNDKDSIDDKPKEPVGPEPIWDGDIEAIAETFCHKCHHPGSERQWKEALSKDSWIQKKASILNNIKSINEAPAIMPPSTDPIDDTSRDRLIFWLENQ